jgi:phosphatidate cytidylyltransferase
MAETDLGRRLIVAGVGIPLGILVIYLGEWFVSGLLAIVAVLGAREVYALTEARGWRPFRGLGAIAAGLLVLAATVGGLTSWSVLAVCIVTAVTLLSLGGAVFSRRPEDGPIGAVASTIMGAVYLGATLSFGVHLRAFPGVSEGSAGWEGALILIFPLFVTWIGDSAAYFSGHRWGRTRLMPLVSPGKTVAGAIGGFGGSVSASVLYSVLLINPHAGVTLPLLSAVGVGVVLGCVAQIGDLAESLLKREAGVKDSGGLFPGHGGVLDRFDSVLFTLPITYGLFYLLLRT